MALLYSLPNVVTQQFPIFRLASFTGGLNNRDSVIEIGNDESPDLQNVDFLSDRTVTKRSGSALLGDDKGNSAALGLHAAYYGNFSAQLLLASQGFATAGLGFRTTGNYTEATLNASGTNNGTKLANADAEMETFYALGDGARAAGQMVFILDGTRYQGYFPIDNKIYAMTAGGMNAPASIGSILRLYKNRMYAVGSTTLPERVYFSDLGNGGNYTAGNFFDVPSQNTNELGTSGDPITALAVYQDRLIIFKNRSIWQWDTNSLRQISSLHGCINKRALCVTDDSLFFADIDGIYRLRGNLLEKISKKIQTTWDAIPASLLTKLNMVYFKGKVYVATGASGATVNNIILTNYTQFPYDNEGQQPWSYWVGANANTLSSAVMKTYQSSNTASPIVCFGCANAQTITVQMETGTDDYDTSAAASVAVNSYYKTKVFPLLAQFKQVFATYKSQSAVSQLQLKVDIDYAMKSVGFLLQMQASGGTYNSSTYGSGVYGGQNAVIAKNNVALRGKFVQYTVTNAGANQPWTLYELRQIYKNVKLR